MERILEEMIREKYREEMKPYGRYGSLSDNIEYQKHHVKMILRKLVDDYWEHRYDRKSTE